MATFVTWVMMLAEPLLMLAPIVWSSFTRVGNMIIDMEIHQAAILKKTAQALVVATNA